MDSLSQIVLGAATGEVVLGKKIGNRAMIWGAVGGTIPDLDVLGKFFLSDLENLAFHRGISHSIFFSVVGAILVGWLVQKMYSSSHHKWIATIFKGLAAILVCFAADFLFKLIFSGSWIPTILFVLTIVFWWFRSSKNKYFSDSWEAPKTNVRGWQWLFFWAFFTHIILDCFTMYGTQMFAPFSNARIAWGTVSVADPLYTIPLIVGLLVAARFSRESRTRQVWNYIGLGLSSFYLLFTVYNKQKVNSTFAAALKTQNIETSRMVTNATILNNILWSCTAEADDCFYMAQYSLFDEIPITFTRVEKNHNLLKNFESDETIQTLRWFSNDFFNVTPSGDNFQLNDLRFGALFDENDVPQDYIFRFQLIDQGDQGYLMKEALGGPPKGGEWEWMIKLFERVAGKKVSEQ